MTNPLKPSDIEDTYNSVCEHSTNAIGDGIEAALKAVEGWLEEACPDRRQYDAQVGHLDTIRKAVADLSSEREAKDRAEAAVRTLAADFLQSKGKVEALRAERDALTSALAGAREAALEQCEMIAFEQHEYEVADAIRALRALPTTEPAKAEEP